MKLRSTPPALKTSFEKDRAIETTSGKTDRARMSRTAGQMKSHLAAPSERQAPRVSAARRAAWPRRADPTGTGSRGSVSTELLLDAKTGDIGSELLVLPDLVGDRVPAIPDGLLGARRVEHIGKVLGDGRVKHVLFVLLGLRNAQVKDEVGVREAGLDGSEVVVGRSLTEAGREP